MDMSPYRDLFISEARNHLSAFNELIVHLEETPDDPAAVNELFRHAHSMKGMASTMGYDQVVGISHVMESQLSRIRSGEFRMGPAFADLLLESSDTLGRLVSKIEAGIDSDEDTTGLVERLTAYDPNAAVTPVSPSTPPDRRADSRTDASAATSHEFRQADTFKSIRIKTETLDHLVNITGELITNRYRLAEAVRIADASECREPLHQLTALLRSLRDEVFKARMLPFSFIAERFPRLVRDLARKQEKDVSLLLEGKEIELDRGILEEIADPIIHILRNAVDHGLESPEERVLAGKSAFSTITITVNRDKDHVEIIIADDGRGMDPERLTQKAIEKRLITAEQAGRMSAQEAYQLICAPGFSTAATVTDISGRGVGMDAVRTAISSLSGVLTIQSKKGEGSRFIMRLPITVSIINALIVRCGTIEVAFPLSVVKRSLELRPAEIFEESGQRMVMSEDSATPLRSLQQALQLPEPAIGADALLPAVVCDVAGTAVAFSVDRILGQQEIFVRPLRSPLSFLRGVGGATVTGDGRVLFVVDVSTLSA